MKSERPYDRTDRVANEIQNILGQIQTQYIDLTELGFITFTKVIVSPDIKHAKIFFGVVNNKKSKAFRKYLGKELTIKFTPALKFYYDDSISHVERIDKLFNELDEKGKS